VRVGSTREWSRRRVAARYRVFDPPSRSRLKRPVWARMLLSSFLFAPICLVAVQTRGECSPAQCTPARSLRNAYRKPCSQEQVLTWSVRHGSRRAPGPKVSVESSPEGDGAADSWPGGACQLLFLTQVVHHASRAAGRAFTIAALRWGGLEAAPRRNC